MATSCTGAFPATACPGRRAVSTSPRAGSCCPSAATSPTWSRRWPTGRRSIAGSRCSSGTWWEAACGCAPAGARYEAGRLVVCAGPWASKLVPELDGLAVPERQVLAWLQPIAPRVLPAGRVPRLQPGGGGGPLLRLPQLPHPRVQVREVPPPRGSGGSRRGAARARAGGRGAAARLRPPLLPGRRGPDADAQGLPLHQQP